MKFLEEVPRPFTTQNTKSFSGREKQRIKSEREAKSES